MSNSESNTGSKPADAPLGMYPARLDDRGRLKLPTVFQHYLSSFPEGKFFVTSLDARVAQIYPISAWRKNEEFFASYRDNPKALKKVLFNAQDLGAEAEIDSQGRITLCPELRRDLDMQGQELHLAVNRGRVDILTEAIYRERKAMAREDSSESVDLLEMGGMQ